jgi:hypothetical protein
MWDNHDTKGSKDNSVSIVSRLRTGRLGFDSRQKQEIFSSQSRPCQLWVYSASYLITQQIFSLGVTKPKSKAHNSPPTTAEINSVWS